MYDQHTTTDNGNLITRVLFTEQRELGLYTTVVRVTTEGKEYAQHATNLQDTFKVLSDVTVDQLTSDPEDKPAYSAVRKDYHFDNVTITVRAPCFHSREFKKFIADAWGRDVEGQCPASEYVDSVCERNPFAQSL